MSKRARKFKKKLRRHWPRYAKALGAVLIVGVIAWLTIESDEDLSVPAWDGKKSALMGVSYDETYKEAMGLLAEGKKSDARKLMHQMAPLSEGKIKPRGYALAHLWMAKDLLGDFKSDFLYDFPLKASRSHLSKPPYSLPSESKTERAKRYLVHAVTLDPALDEPPLALAALWLGRGKRQAAIDVLITAISHQEHPHPELQVALSHTLTYAGDDLVMEDNAWQVLTLLGRSVAGTSRDNAGERMKYALNALILKKYENVSSVLRKMERDFANAERFPHAAASIQGLKMAVPYRQAVILAMDAASQGKVDVKRYQSLVETFGRVLKIQPENVSVINALSQLAKQYPALQADIKTVLAKANQGAKATSGKSAARSHLLLSTLDKGDKASVKKHLEAAVASSPNDADALMGLASLLIKEAQPDFKRINQLAADAIRVQLKQGVKTVDPDCYRIQGEAAIALSQWGSAIVLLEQALSSHPESAKIHQLLAKAYQHAGEPDLAKLHEAKAISQ